MRISKLRAEAPQWSWTAERYGWGWRYRGVLGEQKVTVYAVAQLCGPAEDDYSTAWYVDDGHTAIQYASWWLFNVHHSRV